MIIYMRLSVMIKKQSGNKPIGHRMTKRFKHFLQADSALLNPTIIIDSRRLVEKLIKKTAVTIAILPKLRSRWHTFMTLRNNVENIINSDKARVCYLASCFHKEIE